MQLNKAAFLLSAFFASVFLFSCNQDDLTPKNNPSPEEILNADRAFSDMSRQVGMKKAFLEYIDNDGVLLRPNHMPVVGAESIDFLSQVNDSSYKLSWTPLKGEIARSGDLGFTYGIYELATKDTVLKGTYVSIWKKQNNGAWKFILDSGNEGIGK